VNNNTKHMKYAYVLLIVLLTIYAVAPAIATIAENSKEVSNQYKVFITKQYPDIKPLGMFKQYIIGIEQSDSFNNIVAINVYDNSKRLLGTAEGFGLFISMLKFWKTDKYFMITDGKLVLIWDENLNQVGRFAQDNLKGVVILLNNDLVAWSREVVSVAKSLGYTYVDQYDVWNAVYIFFKNEKIKPKNLLLMTNINVDEIERELHEDFMNTVKSNNGIVIYFNITYQYDLWARTPSEARTKLSVDIVTASRINNTIYAATNVAINVLINARGAYIVRTEDKTETRTYNSTQLIYVPIGLLVVLSSKENATVIDIYSSIEAGASTSVMAYVYEPVFPNKTYQRGLAILFENGTRLDVPIYTSSIAREVYLVNNYEVVHTDSGVTLIYNMDKLVSSFVATEVRDIGMTDDGRIYIVYVNSIGALEIGLLDRYSGRYDKYTLEVKEKAVGLYISDPLLFLGTDTESGTKIYIATAEPLATIAIDFVGAYGSRILNILNGVFSIEYRGVRYSANFDSNPLVLMLPLGTRLNVSVEVPYGRASYSYYIAEPKAYRYDAVVEIVFTPGMPETSIGIKPFYNPFYREFVMIRDTETLKYRLPGARSIDAYGSILAMIEATNNAGTSTVSVYRIDGVKIYSIDLPGILADVKIYYPYMVARGYDRIYVLDLISGQLRAEVKMYASGYDIDVRQEYFVAWTENRVAVTDLRRQTTSYMDMSEYGKVVYATIINGIVYSYIATENRTSNIYVINPNTMSIKEVVPWDGVNILSYASDGVFHAVTYQTKSGEIITDVLSPENGLLKMISNGSVLWIRTLGRTVNIPRASELKGNEFAAMAVLTKSTIDVYVVGMNYLLVHSIAGANTNITDVRFSISFFAVVERFINSTPVIILKDYSGISRVVITASTYPALFTISENMVVYGNAVEVFLIPNPKSAGKYQIEVRVFDERWQPLDASLYLKEFNVEVKTEKGVFRTYLSIPGTYHITVSAPYYKTKDVVLTVNDTNTVAVAGVVLEPQLFTLRVNVMTPEGRIVRNGILTVRGIDIAYEKTVNLTNETPIFQVRRGTYEAEFISPIYTPAKTQIFVENDTAVALVVNRTFVRVNILVVDEAGSPLSDVNLVVELAGAEPLNMMTDAHGSAVVLLPYGAQFNITASKPGYSSFREGYNATASLEAQPLKIVLTKIRGLLTIVLQNEKGGPESGTVLIRDAMGNVIQSLAVSQMSALELDLGFYTVEGTTSDGRTAKTSVTLTEEMPQAVATLVFPQKPEPMYVQIFPYLLIIVLAISVGVVVYRKFFRKTKPKIVK